MGILCYTTQVATTAPERGFVWYYIYMKYIKEKIRFFLYDIQFSVLKMSDDEIARLFIKLKLW